MDDEKFRSDLKKLKEQEQAVRKSALPTETESTGSESSSRAMRYTWLGAEFAAIFFAFVYGGHYLDKTLGTKPWLLLVGVCFGFGIAIYRLIFVARRLSE